ncbi:hypothetical protein M3T53_08095 [Actinomyces sp. B33]|uniref:hypothetical protein n=1 Tax=Actinomyces sp. B33 TaxID=2942131 RepID=UPI002340C718|nr:hypothetical protein [Actinomyces sp. B33]MDC4233664.1 hypothetical protein [Actinomyces sp. B33]
MNAFAVVVALVFAVLAIVLGSTAARARSGALKTGARTGIRRAELLASEGAWRDGHRAAWPLLAMAAGVAAVHGIGALAAGLTMGVQEGHSFLRVIAVAGLVVTVALRLVASAAAVSAVRRRGR